MFLAEAFTDPAMMAKLAEVGFTQSYTYFTWRHDAWELRDYVTELTQTPLADVHAPVVLAQHARTSSTTTSATPPRPRSCIRFVLAATLVPLYGIYSGYELVRERAGQRHHHRVPPLREVRDQGARLRRSRTRWRR